MFERLIEGVEIAFGPPMPAPPPAGLCYSRAFFPKEVMGAPRPWFRLLSRARVEYAAIDAIARMPACLDEEAHPHLAAGIAAHVRGGPGQDDPGVF